MAGSDGNAAGSVDLVEHGRELFASVGCSACHGSDAGGTAIAPPLAGHSELHVRRQVRAPLGIMPPFDRTKVSPEDLDALVAFVESLPVGSGGMDMDEFEGKLGDEDLSFFHHRMALVALDSGDIPQAKRHVEALIPILEGQHLTLMQQALADINAGDTHDAEHLVAGMLADVLPTPDNNLAKLHLQLALAGLRVGDNEAAAHQVADALAEPDAGDLTTGIREVSSLIAANDMAGAEVRLSALLGEESDVKPPQ